MTNEDYFIDNHRGYWLLLKWPEFCAGGDICGTGCERAIPKGDTLLKTGIREMNNGPMLYICHECAKKEV